MALNGAIHAGITAVIGGTSTSIIGSSTITDAAEIARLIAVIAVTAVKLKSAYTASLLRL